MASSLSLIIPTVSRPTLVRTLASLRTQPWGVGDEILLVGDGEQPTAKILWDQFGLPGRYIEVPGPSKDWGHSPRNLVMPLATGDYIAALDDDDQWTSDALATIRKAISACPDRPLMFRMTGAPCRGTVWKSKQVEYANVGTPMFVLPTAGKRWAKYTPRYGGDCDFIRDTLALWPTDSLVWREEVIAMIRPNS